MRVQTQRSTSGGFDRTVALLQKEKTNLLYVWLTDFEIHTKSKEVYIQIKRMGQFCIGIYLI